MTKTTLARLLGAGVARLRDAGIDDAVRDARLLLADAAELPQGRLTLHLGDPAGPATARRFEERIGSRAARVPVSRILGRRSFFGREFEVTPDVLDPRPETETLVAAALAAPFDRVLDLGTGTGCLLVTLLAERSDATGLGTDISPGALDVARRNADWLGVSHRADWAAGDWLAPVTGSFDLIVSNPPYIAENEMQDLSAEVREGDPRIALTPGGDGLGAYRAILRDAPAHLTASGRLAVEIGCGQERAVTALFAASGLRRIGVIADLDGRPRVIEGRF